MGWVGDKKNDSLVRDELVKGTRYWGTSGRYVKKDQLLGFVEEVGHGISDVSDISVIAESIMEHGIEEEEKGHPNPEPDPLVVLIVASEAVRRAQVTDSSDYEGELASEDDDE